MPRRQRDYKAEYAARQARAKAEGFRSYAEKRPARAAGVPDPERYRKMAAEKRKAAEKIREVTRRQVHQLEDTKLVTTTTGGKGWATIQRQLADHGTRPAVVHIILKDGSRRTVYGNGISAKSLRPKLRSMEDAADVANTTTKYGSSIAASDIASVQIELGDAV